MPQPTPSRSGFEIPTRNGKSPGLFGSSEIGGKDRLEYNGVDIQAGHNKQRMGRCKTMRRGTASTRQKNERDSSAVVVGNTSFKDGMRFALIYRRRVTNDRQTGRGSLDSAVQTKKGLCLDGGLHCVRLADVVAFDFGAASELEELLVQLSADDCAWTFEHRWGWPTPSSAGG